MPLLSIIIPHRNNGESLPRLLESIERQTFTDLEVLVVDDNSEQSCRPLVDACKGRGLAITLLENTTRIYTMKARLAGIYAAKGAIIGFADADDVLWGEEALERNVRLFYERQADILHFRTALVDATGNFAAYTPEADPRHAQLAGKDILAAHVSSPHFWAASSLWNKLFSRDLCLQAAAIADGTRVKRLIEDIYLLILLMFHAERYVGSPHVGYGHYYVESKKIAQAGEKALYLYHALQELPPYLEKNECPRQTIAWCSHVLRQLLCLAVGHMTMLREWGNGTVTDAELDSFLVHGDAETLLKALLLGNSLIAVRLRGNKKVQNLSEMWYRNLAETLATQGDFGLESP